MMRYLAHSQEFELTLSIGNEFIIHWYIDALYAVHDDLRSHTGAAMRIGIGAAINLSTKQKLNV